MAIPHDQALGWRKQHLPTIAYVVLAHTHPEQLARMVRALAFDNVRFIVHVEKRIPVEPFRACLPESSSVTYLSSREDGHWGGFGIVRASLRGLRLALSPNSGGPPDFIGLLSGQDYPIQSPLRIARFLAEHPGRSFIEHAPLPVPGLRNGGLDRVECYSRSWRGRRYTYYPRRFLRGFNWGGRILNTALRIVFLPKGQRRHPAYAAPHYGSQWWLISREAAEAILRFLDRHPDFERYHRDSLLPDELFFQTILANADDTLPKGHVLDRNLHFIRWPEGSSSPAILGCSDLETMRASGRFFARKLDSTLDPHVLDRLDEVLASQSAS